MRPTIVSLMRDEMYDLVFGQAAERKLTGFAAFRRYRGAADADEDALIGLLQGADAAITCWGVKLTDRVVQATDLKVIGHAAGSVKGFPPAVWERGIAVTHAAPVIAVAVGEMALALTLACLRHFPAHQDAFRHQGLRGDPSIQPRLLANRSLHELRVGIVGASATGREFVKLLRAFGDVEVWISDPYLSAEDADHLGVRKVELPDLLSQCDVVSLHCPSLPETRHLISAETAALLKDGTVLINTARGALVDYDALLPHLQSGRLSAGLDVYLETLADEEIPASAYRELDNVVITPGIAGPVGTITKRMSLYIAEELERFFRGEPLRKPVTGDMLAHIA
ncbi:MAG: hydroxyacid dehydrogenase [Anaerolineae bacterium]|nr:hydroxyacid dehydrogenase [Anaerolineae bacterium]